MFNVNPYDAPRHLDEPAPTLVSVIPFSAGGFLVSLLTMALLQCACNQVHPLVVWGTGIGAALAWAGILTSTGDDLLNRIGSGVVVLLTSSIFFLKLCSVLWPAHPPFLR